MPRSDVELRTIEVAAMRRAHLSLGSSGVESLIPQGRLAVHNDGVLWAVEALSDYREAQSYLMALLGTLRLREVP